MMGGGSTPGDDPNIKVSNINVNTAGTQITASVQVLSTATPGTRQIRLGTNYGDMMGMMNSTLFTVTQGYGPGTERDGFSVNCPVELHQGAERHADKSGISDYFLVSAIQQILGVVLVAYFINPAPSEIYTLRIF